MASIQSNTRPNAGSFSPPPFSSYTDQQTTKQDGTSLARGQIKVQGQIEKVGELGTALNLGAQGMKQSGIGPKSNLAMAGGAILSEDTGRGGPNKGQLLKKMSKEEVNSSNNAN